MPSSRDAGEEKQPPKTRKLNVWLLPEQIEWLKRDKDGPSSAVRALIVEAMNMENLVRSVKSGKRKPRK